jgi:hypothetical protein
MKLRHITEYNSFEPTQERLNEEDLAATGDPGDIWERFKKTIASIFSPSSNPPKKPTAKPAAPPKKAEDSPLVGEHMLYLPHQQGPAGAADIVRVAKGTKPLEPALRAKLLNNMPSSDPRYATVKNGKSIAAVMAFLSYQKGTWEGFKKDAMQQIEEPQNKPVKDAIKAIKEPKLPFDFLATVAYKESRFVPNPAGNKSYRGLYQIGDSAWDELKRLFPTKYKGGKAPLNPAKNTQAGYDLLVLSYDGFERRVGDLV